MSAETTMLKQLLARREAELREGNDGAAPSGTRSHDAAAQERRLVELRCIEAAQWRLAEGSYGTCALCAEPIEFRRLVALPTAERCGPCDVAHERWQQYLQNRHGGPRSEVSREANTLTPRYASPPTQTHRPSPVHD